MIDAQGTITKVDGDFATVLMDETGCGRCHEQGGCGGNNIGKMFCSTPRTFLVLNPGKALPGQRVLIAISEGAVRHSAFYAYVFPLFSLFSGAFIGEILGGESGAIAGMFGGLLVAWLALRRAHMKSNLTQKFQAYIRT